MRIAPALIFITVVILAVASSVFAAGSGFIENRGQVHPRVVYYAIGSHGMLYFTPDAIVVDLVDASCDNSRRASLPEHAPDPAMTEPPVPRRGCAVYLRFEAANPMPVIEARGRLDVVYNYFLGSNPARWRTEVPTFSEIVYRGLWPGVDLTLREDGGGISYDVEVAPGADPAAVRLAYEGADHLLLHDDGEIWIETVPGVLVHRPALPGLREGWIGGPPDVSASAPADPASSKRDDPSVLLWSTFLGGSDYDYGNSIALDSSGRPVVAGATGSSDFPVTPGAYDQTISTPYDVFVAKLTASGSSLVWGTFIGGTGNDAATDVVVDRDGDTVLTGNTSSSDFPTTPGAYDRSHNGDNDVFVAKLSASGSSLAWSTYLGGSGQDVSAALDLDSLLNPLVTGSTRSSGFPATVGAFDTSLGGTEDAFVTKISSSGASLLWSTFLGGSEFDNGYGVAVDDSGNPVVTGTTGSTSFPTTPGAYDTSKNPGDDGIVSKFNLDGLIGVGDVPSGVGSLNLCSEPNPTSGAVSLRYLLPREMRVILQVADVSGRVLAVWEMGSQSAGSHGFDWDGRDAGGRRVVPGVYFARLLADRVGTMGKLVVAR